MVVVDRVVTIKTKAENPAIAPVQSKKAEQETPSKSSEKKQGTKK